MPERDIELTWNCADCDTKGIKGRHKKCPDCGSPREKGEMSMDGLGADSYDAAGQNRAETVTDPNLLKLANAGADWFCSHCGSGNIGNGSKCSSCAGPRYAIAEEDAPGAEGDHEHVEGVDAKLAREMNHDPRPVEPGPEEGFETPRGPPPRDTTWKPESYGDRAVAGGVSLGVLAAVGAGVLCLIGFIAFIVWAMQTHEVTGAVSGMTWTRAMHIQRWTDTTTRLFQFQTTETPEVPPHAGHGESAGLALVQGSCRQEYYTTEKVACGSHQHAVTRRERYSYACTKPGPDVACGKTPEHCTGKKNGFAHCTGGDTKYCDGPPVSTTCHDYHDVFDHNETVTDYCDHEVDKAKCDYQTQEWRNAGDFPTSGRGNAFTWTTQADLPDNERATYSAAYTVAVVYNDHGTQGDYDIVSSVDGVSKSAAEQAATPYLTWNIGDPVHLDVNNLGGVSAASHVK